MDYLYFINSSEASLSYRRDAFSIEFFVLNKFVQTENEKIGEDYCTVKILYSVL